MLKKATGKTAAVILAAACMALSACSGGQSSASSSQQPETSENQETSADQETLETQENQEQTESAASEEPAPSTDDLVSYEIYYRMAPANYYIDKVVHYTYDLFGNVLTREDKYDIDYEPYNVRYYSYDAFGNLEGYTSDDGSYAVYYPETGRLAKSRSAEGRVLEYDENGNLTHDYIPKEARHYLYFYDENGRILTEEDYRGAEDEVYGELLLRLEYTYSEDGLYGTSAAFGPDGSEIEYFGGFCEEFEYDESGNMIYRHSSSVSGEHDREFFYEYDDDGNLIHYTKSGEEDFWTYENGVLTEKIVEGDYVITYTTYERDQYGRVLSTTVTAIDKSTNEVYKEYISALNEYDERGNLSRAYTYSETTEEGSFESLTVYVYGNEDPYKKLLPVED
ncbi:MAG: hypothetical protein K5637_00535 [Lachnospiraceae bacterium]|nr:hypothetical protein [Lachnospiraceae bacterium]